MTRSHILQSDWSTGGQYESVLQGNNGIFLIAMAILEEAIPFMAKQFDGLERDLVELYGSSLTSSSLFISPPPFY
jgi:hypothetical protein